MKFEFDLSELYEFGDRLADIAKFETLCKEIIKQLAKDLHEMLIKQTPVKTGHLVTGWMGSENFAYTIKAVEKGYEIDLVNTVSYAVDVNDGHYSHNQYGGPYEVKNRTVPYTQGKKGKTFVYGHFFVEKSILLMKNDTFLNSIIEKELEKWFGWCVDGK